MCAHIHPVTLKTTVRSRAEAIREKTGADLARISNQPSGSGGGCFNVAWRETYIYFFMLLCWTEENHW